MKKLYQTVKYKEYCRLRTQKALLRKLRKRVKKSLIKSVFNTLSKTDKHNFINARKSKHLILPANMSFIENTNEYVKFLIDLLSQNQINKDLYLDSKHITNLTPDAIVALFGFMSRVNTHDRKVVGSYPSNPILRNKWKSTGFETIISQGKLKNKLETEGLILKSSTLADNDAAAELIEFASMKFENCSCTRKGVYSTYIELMGNTHEHANPSHKGSEKWWASVYYDNNNNKACFSFIDFGNGIFDTIKKKFAHYFRFSRIEIFQKLIKGEIKISNTKKGNRCNGLHNIYKYYERNHFKRLIFITNNLYADIENDNYFLLENEFKGTFCYWEFDDECENNINS